MISWLLLACAVTLDAQLSVVSQFPGLVEVKAGGTVSLQCNVSGLATLMFCYAVVWTRIHPRTRTMITCKGTSMEDTSQNSGVCSLYIHNATVDDSGTYYCSAANSKVIYMGNGSTVVVRKDRKIAPPPIEIFRSSDKIHRPFVPLMCLVSGVVPQQAHVFWVVDGDEKSGLTESIWTKDGDAIIESTQNQVLVPVEVWERGALCTCVVVFDGRNTSKSVQRPDYWTICYAVVVPYRAMGVTACLVFGIMIVTVASCCSRRKNSDGSFDAVKHKKNIAEE